MMPKDLYAKNSDDVVPDWRKNAKSIEKYGFVYSFIPHPKRGRRARLLSNKALSLYTLFVFVLILLFRFVPKYVPGVLGYASDIYVTELLEYTNNRRAAADLPPLKLNNDLSRAAYAKAQDMFENNYWAHVSPDGVQPWDFIIGAGYDYSYAGENLAKNFNASKEVVDAWYASESHRQNLLGANYEDIGFAIVDGVLDGYETTLVVQTFGRPRQPTYLSSAQVEPAPETSLQVEVPSEEAPSTDLPAEPSEVPSEVFLDADDQDTPSFVGSAEASSGPRSGMLVDVRSAANFINFGLVTFLAILLMVDILYSRKKGLRRVSGHAVAHLLFLVFVFIGMWLVLSPGKIL
jgi:hypothetical protein